MSASALRGQSYAGACLPPEQKTTPISVNSQVSMRVASATLVVTRSRLVQACDRAHHGAR